ncbi:MAG: histone deacetylase family protein [Bryobacteraceae bacterium]
MDRTGLAAKVQSRTGIASDPAVKRHDPGPDHPERPQRYDAVMSRLESTGVLETLLWLEVRSASKDELALVHRLEYIELVEREVAQNRRQLSTGDTDISSHSLESAKAAAGCVLSAVDAVFAGSVINAFCAARPPGHHASSTRGMGFCLFNNVALGARYAQQKYGVERVLIADWDVHHGNGTQDIFYKDGSVLFFSTHQSPWYPGTGDSSEEGEGPGAGKTINCPLPAGSGRAQIMAAFQQRLMPAAKRFQPDFVLISAGFDSRLNDPLGLFLLTDEDFRDLTRLMTDFAAEYCSGRLVSVLEGGYSFEGLALATEAHVRALSAE